MLDDSKNKCYVPCKQWEWRNTPEKLLRNAATYITSLTSLVSVTIMIITWIKLKHLWSFPLVTPFYALLLRAIFVLSLTIPDWFAREAFCSDKDLSQSIENPTTFCFISGDEHDS
jgi:hypothetical protein